jgi:hypothetical protein
MTKRQAFRRLHEQYDRQAREAEARGEHDDAEVFKRRREHISALIGALATVANREEESRWRRWREEIARR